MINFSLIRISTRLSVIFRTVVKNFSSIWIQCSLRFCFLLKCKKIFLTILTKNRWCWIEQLLYLILNSQLLNQMLLFWLFSMNLQSSKISHSLNPQLFELQWTLSLFDVLKSNFVHFLSSFIYLLNFWKTISNNWTNID